MKKFLILFTVALAGCTWKPYGPPPEVSLPEDYLEDRFPDPPGQEVDLAMWWKQFKDPLLNALIETACTDNFEIRIAMEKVMEVRELYRVEFSRYWPQIDYDMFVQRTRRSANLFAEEFLGPLYQTLYTLNFIATWELDLFGKTYQRAQAAIGEFEASRENLHFTKLTVISEIAQTYTEIRYYQELVEVTLEEIEVITGIVNLIEDRYDAGLISEDDLNDAKELLENTTSTLFPLESILQQAILRMGVLTGKTPESLIEILSIPSSVPIAEGKIPVGLPSDLMRRRPDIRRAERELEAAGARVQVAKADLFPQFSLIGSYGLQSVFPNKWFDASSRAWSIIPGFSWPIFTAGRIQANIRAETHRQQQASLTYEQTILRALDEVERSLTAYFEESQRGDHLEKVVATTSDTRALTMDRYRAGLQSFTPVLDLERRVLSAKKEAIASRQEMLLNLIAVYKSLGGGWECSDTQ